MLTLALSAALLGQAIDYTAAYRSSLGSVVWVINVSDQLVASGGTGVVIDSDKGLILTAYHVAPGGDNSVYFPERNAKGELIVDRAAYLNAANPKSHSCTILRSDPKLDLWILQLLKKPEGLKSLKVATKSIEPGESLFLIGNSGAALWRFSMGNVRQVFYSTYTVGKREMTSWILETTVPVNEGDSGAPLLTAAGEIAGIVSSSQPNCDHAQQSIAAIEIRKFLAGK